MPFKFLQKLFSGFSRKPSDRLVQCIHLEEGEFVFHLNELVIKSLDQVRSNGDRLNIPPRHLSRLLVPLREVALIERGSEPRFQSGLTFKSYYVSPQERKGQFVVRTVVSLDGDIINQIHQDLIAEPYCLDLVQVHYWLIDQLLAYLRVKTTQLIDRLAWTIAILIVWIPTLMGVMINYLIDPQQTIKFLVLEVFLPFLLAGFLTIFVQKLVKKLLILFSPRLRCWAFEQLTSENRFIQNLARGIWGRFLV